MRFLEDDACIVTTGDELEFRSTADLFLVNIRIKVKNKTNLVRYL